jgi:tripartite-type tricarboxylate transporter receptor subunit TctC
VPPAGDEESNKTGRESWTLLGTDRREEKPMIEHAKFRRAGLARRQLLSAALAGGVALGARAAAAQEWPARPVRVILPYAAGGMTDSQARITAERLSALLGQSFVIENRSGAGGAIAASAVARAAPDGYTLFFGAGSQIVTVPLTQRVDYDPKRDLAPVSLVGLSPFIVTVPASLPVTSLTELVAHAKANPGKVTFASSGAGSVNHLAATALATRAGVEMVHVPYRGSAPALVDLMAGRVQLYFANPAEVVQLAAEGKVKLLAMSFEQRLPQWPELPAVAETYPGYALTAWNGYFAPGGTPAPIVERLSKAIAAVVAEPETNTKLTGLGIEAVGNSPEAFRVLIERETALLEAAARAANLRAD